MTPRTPRWRRYLRFWRADVRADVEEELALHLELLSRDLQARGLAPDEARARAESMFGDPRVVRDALVRLEDRHRRTLSRMEVVESMWNDLRFAARSLRKSPGFATVAILCVALGVCVTTTIFSAVDTILIRPLPYPDADRLVTVYAENVPRGYHETNISYKDYASWRDDNSTFSALGIWTWVTKTITAGESERVAGASVSANLFPLLGVHPVLGRDFRSEEERQGRSDVVLFSYGLWQRRFGGDSSIVGRVVSMDGRPHLVAGIMPPHFNFPERADFWMPFTIDGPSRESHSDRGYAGAIGRLRPGVTLEQAKADLARVSVKLQRDFPVENTGWAAEALSLRDDLTGDLRRPVLVFFGAVALVLLIACANVANLMLARGTSRHRELAVRTALGAPRRRLVRQLLTESLLIAVIGGVLGAIGGVLATRLAPFAFPNGVPYYLSFGVDARALAFAAFVIVLTGVLFGAIPAVRSTRVEINAALRDGGRGGEEATRGRLRATLVVAEIALSLVVMVGAMLLIRSYRAYMHTDLGFHTAGVLTARVTLPEFKYDDSGRRIAFFQQLEQRVAAIPGVQVVGSAQGIPFSGWDVQGDVSFLGRPAARANEEYVSHFQAVFPSFFTAMGIRLVRGRMITLADRDTLAPVAVVNEQFAKTAYPGEDPIGKRVKFAPADNPSPWITIVGVVSDYRHYRLPQPMGPALYEPYTVAQSRSQTLVIRTGLADPYAIATSVRATLRDIDPQVAPYDVQTMGDAVSRSLWRQRLQGEVLGIFAVLALLLATVGIYGVVSYAVAQRTREIGVRMALGAQRANVVRLVLAQGARLALAGIVLGAGAALLLSRAVASLLYGVSATDAVSFLLVSLALGVTTCAATYIPAARAARVDPLIAMRAE